jgi:hypothetical protein
MSKIATVTNTVLFGEYTNKNTHHVDAPALMVETKLVNELNTVRKDLGLKAIRNAYPWWAYTLATLTYFPSGHYSSMNDVDMFLQESNIIVRNLQKYSTLLNNSIEGQGPCKIRREYAGKLPLLTGMLKMKSERLKNFYGRGRRPIGFSYNNPVTARQTLIDTYPDIIHLFRQLDYVKG